jgi:hypothetical protein
MSTTRTGSKDYLEIVDAEPGKIWFENGVGPIAVPRASDLARPGWSAFVTAARIDKRWHSGGVVYPDVRSQRLRDRWMCMAIPDPIENPP